MFVKRLGTFVIIVIIIFTIIAYQSFMFNSVCFMGLEVALIFDFEKEFVIGLTIILKPNFKLIVYGRHSYHFLIHVKVISRRVIL